MSGGSRDEGQSSIEFAIIVPVVFTLMLFAAQLGVLVLGQVAVTRAAHEVARSVSVDPALEAMAIAEQVALFGSGELDVVVDYRPSPVEDRELITVTITADVPRIAPLRWMLPAVVSGTAVTLSEQ